MANEIPTRRFGDVEQRKKNERRHRQVQRLPSSSFSLFLAWQKKRKTSKWKMAPTCRIGQSETGVARVTASGVGGRVGSR